MGQLSVEQKKFRRRFLGQLSLGKFRWGKCRSIKKRGKKDTFLRFFIKKPTGLEQNETENGSSIPDETVIEAPIVLLFD